MSYIPALILLLAGSLVAVAVLTLTTLLGRGVSNFHKRQPFECGLPSVGSAERRFSVRFYLVAILFLLFDVETIFFFPFALIYRKGLASGPGILIEMGFFFLILCVAYGYVLKKDALEWE